MRRLLPVLTLLVLSALGSSLRAQSAGYPYIRNYLPREFKASSANYVAVQDQRGVMYFGNYWGILEYDGANWRLIPTPNHATVRSLVVDSTGRVYAGAAGDFGYLKADSNGKQVFQSLLGKVSESERHFSGLVRAIGTPQGAYFQVLETRKLYYYTPDTLISFDLSYLSENVMLHLIEGYLHAAPLNEGLLKLSRGQFRPVPGGEALIGKMPVATVSLGPDQTLLRAYQEGFYRLQYHQDSVSLHPWATDIDRELAAGVFSDLIRLHNGNLLVSTFKQGAFELSPAGKLVRRYHEDAGLLDNIILGSFQDQQRSLWLMVSRGITRIEVASPLSHYAEEAGLPGIVFATIRHQGQLYAGTPLGVFRLQKNRFVPVRGLEEETWQFYQVPSRGRNRLLVHTIRGIYEVVNGRGQILFDEDLYLSVTTSPALQEGAIALSASAGPQMIRRQRNRWEVSDEIPKLNFRVASMVMDDAGVLWLTPEDQRSLRMVAMSPGPEGDYRIVRRYDSSQLPRVQNPYLVEGKVALVTDHGIFRITQEQNFQPLTQLNQMLGDGETGIGYLVEDQQGRLWVERFRNQRRWVEVLLPQDESLTYVRDSLMLSELADVEIWGKVYIEPEGLTWIGTPE
ncbi:MAG: hypothetical protein AAF804_04760, partial [Bacteroidota bacterium]